MIDWAEKQVVRPDLEDTSGSGTPRRYSDANLLEFAVAKELVAVGLPVSRIKKLLDLVKSSVERLIYWQMLEMRWNFLAML